MTQSIFDRNGLLYSGTVEGTIEIWKQNDLKGKPFVIVCTPNKAVAAIKYCTNYENKKESGMLISVDVANIYRLFACHKGKIQNTHAIILNDTFNIEINKLFIHFESN